jgi:site-specific recombinase XerD
MAHVLQPPFVTIYVRHNSACPHRDEFYRRCDCWKHLRWYYGGKQYRKTAKSRTWAGAERAKREVEFSYENASVGETTQNTEGISVNQAIRVFLEDKEGKNMDPVTLKKYRRELGRFQEFCNRHGRHFLQDVGLHDLTEFRSTWEQEYPSTVTRQKVQERLRSFFKYGLNAGFIPKNPAAAMSSIKVQPSPALPLEPDQYIALLKAVPQVFTDPLKAAKIRALIRCMRHTGLSIGEAVCLERTQVRHDAEKRIARIVRWWSKTGVEVSVPVPADVATELLAVANGNPRYVFFQSGDVQPGTATKKWHKDLHALFLKAGLPEGRPHQLRDTAAVEWLNAGIPLEEVSCLLGHASIRTTEKLYAPWVKLRQDRLDALVVATWAAQKQS